MLIALLALLGVDLVVIVLLLAGVVSRRRWIKRRPGVFPAALRVADGECDGIPARFRRGYGRWVSDVLVWTKAPFLFRNELVAADRVNGVRPARPGEVKRLGDEPVVVAISAKGAVIEIAVRGEHVDLAIAPSIARAPEERSTPAGVGHPR